MCYLAFVLIPKPNLSFSMNSQITLKVFKYNSLLPIFDLWKLQIC